MSAMIKMDGIKVRQKIRGNHSADNVRIDGPACRQVGEEIAVVEGSK